MKVSLKISDPRRIDRWLRRYGSAIQLVAIGAFLAGWVIAAVLNIRFDDRGGALAGVFVAIGVTGASGVLAYWVYLLGDDDPEDAGGDNEE